MEINFLNVYQGKVRLQLERKAFRDRYLANELEALKPKGGDGRSMQPNMGQRKDPARHCGKKYLGIFQPVYPPKPKKQLFC